MDLPSNRDAEKMAVAAGAMGCVITLIFSSGRSVSVNWFVPKTVDRSELISGLDSILTAMDDGENSYPGRRR